MIKYQSTIGWKHLLYGRFSTEWIYLHESVLNRQNKKRNDGEKWLIGLIVLIWTHQHKRWSLRNKCTHDTTEGPSPNETAVTAQIRSLYLHRHRYLPTCQHAFTTPLPTLLQSSSRAQSAWLDNNLPALRAHLITPTPPTPQERRSLSVLSPNTPALNNNTPNSTVPRKNNENSNISNIQTLTPIRPRSERVSSPRAVPNDTYC